MYFKQRAVPLMQWDCWGLCLCITMRVCVLITVHTRASLETISVASLVCLLPLVDCFYIFLDKFCGKMYVSACLCASCCHTASCDPPCSPS